MTQLNIIDFLKVFIFLLEPRLFPTNIANKNNVFYLECNGNENIQGTQHHLLGSQLYLIL